MPDTDRTPVKTGPWRWALIRSDLPGAARHVALTLAVRMDEDGTIPRRYKVGVRRIAIDAGVHRNTVTPALRVLLERGFLEESEPAAGTRPARYRATLPRHNHCATEPPDERATVAQQEGHNAPQRHNDCATGPVGNGAPTVDNRPDSVDDAGDGESLWHNADALVAQRGRSSGTTTGPHPAVPAESSTSSSATSTSGHGAPAASLDDLDRVTRLRYLRQARDDLARRGYDDPPLDVIHVRAQELLDATLRQAQA